MQKGIIWEIKIRTQGFTLTHSTSLCKTVYSLKDYACGVADSAKARNWSGSALNPGASPCVRQGAVRKTADSVLCTGRYFSRLWSLGVWDQGSARLGPPEDPVQRVCPDLAPRSVHSRLLPVCSHHLPCGHTCVHMPSFYKDVSQMDQGFLWWPHFNLIPSLRTLSQNIWDAGD